MTIKLRTENTQAKRLCSMKNSTQLEDLQRRDTDSDSNYERVTD
jgi:hypothetical protein